MGMNFRAGYRTTRAEKIGWKSRVPTRVPANSQGSCDTPDEAATASRIGRSTYQLLSTKKKYAKETNTARTSSSFTSTARRSRRPVVVDSVNVPDAAFEEGNEARTGARSKAWYHARLRAL